MCVASDVVGMIKPAQNQPRLLLKMAVEQSSYETTSKVIDEIFGTILSRNEVTWLEALRDAAEALCAGLLHIPDTRSRIFGLGEDKRIS